MRSSFVRSKHHAETRAISVGKCHENHHHSCDPVPSDDVRPDAEDEEWDEQKSKEYYQSDDFGVSENNPPRQRASRAVKDIKQSLFYWDRVKDGDRIIKQSNIHPLIAYYQENGRPRRTQLGRRYLDDNGGEESEGDQEHDEYVELHEPNLQRHPEHVDFLFLLLLGLDGGGGAFYQGGLFGFADLFPPRYTVALMSGNGVAGVLASILTIVTTAAFPNNNNGSLEGAAMNEEGAEIINPKTKIPIDTDQ